MTCRCYKIKTFPSSSFFLSLSESEFLVFSFTVHREGARVVWGYIDRILGQPSLIRESSRGKYPWSGLFSRSFSSLFKKSDSGLGAKSKKDGFGDVILHPSLQTRIQQLASATANTKAHQAPFRNMLFYGPPGTGKTMAARELAQKSVISFSIYLILFIKIEFFLCWLWLFRALTTL